MTGDGEKIYVDVEAQFEPYIDAAVARLGYLQPSVRIVRQDSRVAIYPPTSGQTHDIVREFRFALYRQKIYAETLDLRSRLIGGILGS